MLKGSWLRPWRFLMHKNQCYDKKKIIKKYVTIFVSWFPNKDSLWYLLSRLLLRVSLLIIETDTLGTRYCVSLILHFEPVKVQHCEDVKYNGTRVQYGMMTFQWIARGLLLGYAQHDTMRWMFLAETQNNHISLIDTYKTTWRKKHVNIIETFWSLPCSCIRRVN